MTGSGSGAGSAMSPVYESDAGSEGGTVALGTAAASGSASYTVTYTTAAANATGSILAFRGSANSDPVFANGTSAGLTVDEDAAAASLSTQLEVDDSDTGQTLTWTVASGPSNGALSGFPATASRVPACSRVVSLMSPIPITSVAIALYLSTTGNLFAGPTTHRERRPSTTSRPSSSAPLRPGQENVRPCSTTTPRTAATARPTAA